MVSASKTHTWRVRERFEPSAVMNSGARPISAVPGQYQAFRSAMADFAAVTFPVGQPLRRVKGWMVLLSRTEIVHLTENIVQPGLVTEVVGIGVGVMLGRSFVSGRCRWLWRFDRCVLNGVINCLLDGNPIAGVVGDGVIEQLRGPRIYLQIVFGSDVAGHLLKHLARFGIQVRTSDLDLSAHVGGSDTVGEFVGGLVIEFRDLAMPILVFDHVFGRADRKPDVDIEVQRYFDLCEHDDSVRGIRFSRLASDAGTGKEIGIAHGNFSHGQRWHSDLRVDWVKVVGRENDRQSEDSKRGRNLNLKP
jgi:hypothetical protein